MNLDPPEREPISAVILAGSRPLADPLARHHQVAVKALVPVAGDAMLCHVARNLIASPLIGRIKIVAQDIDIFKTDPQTAWLAAEPNIELQVSAGTIAATIEDILSATDAQFPLFVTTADNVLLTSDMIETFLSGAENSDLAMAVVEQKTLLAVFPETRRTWIKLRGEAFSGANLFYFENAAALKILRIWAKVEQQRKKGWRIFTTFGPTLLFLALTRAINLEQFAKRLSAIAEAKVGFVRMSQAEACIDVDKQDDLIMAEQIIRERAS